ncbi:long-chain-fatty-acid--coa ligase 5 [Anaeramoeba flamelloides]|uniref:Long-chain-fatty-acid--coa ligase 5 n=1 Tax=Anaeramoeba flamelloides TaxID=1746091 RepID=A0ABQ8YJS4_9EUKA|nr:long-chain-fatty-acid--coa ligase 5 [Anaeramoeba flamelloides]
MNKQQQKNIINKNQKPTYRDLPSFQRVLLLSSTADLETSFVYQRMPKCRKQSYPKNKYMEFIHPEKIIKKADNENVQSPRQTINYEENGEKIYRCDRIGRGPLQDVVDERIKTVYDLLEVTSQDKPNNLLFGTRKQLENNQYGAYEWVTYGKFASMRKYFGSGLVHLGAAKGEPIAIWSRNRLEWVLASHSCYPYNLFNVALYDTLGPESSSFILKQIEAKFLVCDKAKIPVILELKKKCTNLKHIICMDENIIESYKEKAESIGLKLYTVKEILKIGEETFSEEKLDLPTPEDVCMIMYTSGTTGSPKGVILTHKNYIAGTVNPINTNIIPNGNDCLISYLPLAHIYEKMMESWIIYGHGRIGFFSGNIRNLTSDMNQLKPTVFPVVPRVVSRIYDNVMGKISRSPWHIRQLFKFCYWAKSNDLKRGRKFVLWDILIFNKIKEQVGKNIRLMATTSAPISKTHHNFARVCLCSLLPQSYGMTETAGAGAIQRKGKISLGNVGPPPADIEVKLVDVPEMEYLTSNGEGEIWMRGPSVFGGYYKNKEETEKVLTEDGWLKSGDIGRINANGTFSIIDRKKNILKLQQGEYVSPKYLESIFVRCPSISQCYVYGSSFENFLVAIIVPDFEALGHVNQSDEEELKKLVEDDPKIKKQIENELFEISNKEKLKGFEYIKTFHLEHKNFSIENGLLTDTYKLKRLTAKKVYQKIIIQLYERVNKEMGKTATDKNKTPVSKKDK